jgi:hypothetical protein
MTLRRLHQVREALRNAEPDELTVTSVAAQYGFWQFGRFAGQYRRLFGELPSDTLSHKKWNRRQTQIAPKAAWANAGEPLIP